MKKDIKSSGFIHFDDVVPSTALVHSAAIMVWSDGR